MKDSVFIPVPLHSKPTNVVRLNLKEKCNGVLQDVLLKKYLEINLSVDLIVLYNFLFLAVI